jgi:hypothetical protein
MGGLVYMSENRIVVDIGQAAEQLRANPALADELTRLIGGPALVEALEANEKLVELLQRILCEWDVRRGNLQASTITEIREVLANPLSANTTRVVPVMSDAERRAINTQDILDKLREDMRADDNDLTVDALLEHLRSYLNREYILEAFENVFKVECTDDADIHNTSTR